MTINRTTFFAYCRRAPFGGRLTQQQIDGMTCILAAWDGTDLRHLAYTLATAFHETGSRMVPVREGFAKTDAGARKIVANRRYGKPDPKHVYYGRGLVQLTWAENYKRLGQKLGIDLYNEPDLALDPEVSATILVRGMAEGLYSGRKLSDYFNDLVDDPKGARKIVNGADKASLIATYHEQFLGALQAADEATPQPADVTPKDAAPDAPPLMKDPATIGTLASAAGGVTASLLAAVNNPWALAAVVVIAVGVWLFLSGRLQIRRTAGA